MMDECELEIRYSDIVTIIIITVKYNFYHCETVLIFLELLGKILR